MGTHVIIGSSSLVTNFFQILKKKLASRSIQNQKCHLIIS